MPGRAAARLAAADDQVADVEVPVRRLARLVRDLVDVEVERPWRRRMELDLERRLLARLAQRCRLERGVALLDVSARLQQPPELRVLDEARALAGLVDHERRRREVRARLVA